MIVSLDTDYRSQLLFSPTRQPSGALLGVEVIATFNTVHARVRIPTEFILPRMGNEQQLILFYEKISLIERQRDFFLKHNLIAWVNINEVVAAAILASRPLKRRLGELPFLELSINESFPGLNQGKNNPALHTLSELHSLMLANFGSDSATNQAVYDGLFRRVVLDKPFLYKKISPVSFAPFMRAIVMQISPYCETLIIPGIDNDERREQAVALGFSGMQGNLWPQVEDNQLVSLLAVA